MIFSYECDKNKYYLMFLIDDNVRNRTLTLIEREDDTRS
jgi:hypothetical protein